MSLSPNTVLLHADFMLANEHGNTVCNTIYRISTRADIHTQPRSYTTDSYQWWFKIEFGPDHWDISSAVETTRSNSLVNEPVTKINTRTSFFINPNFTAQTTSDMPWPRVFLQLAGILWISPLGVAPSHIQPWQLTNGLLGKRGRVKVSECLKICQIHLFF